MMFKQNPKLLSNLNRGFTLIELIIFIMVISIALAGILLIINQTTRSSAEPQIRTQLGLITQSMMDEVLLHSYTLCDARDPNAETAITAAQCFTLPNVTGPEIGEARGSFNHVDDYHGFTSTGIFDILGQPMEGLGDYNVAVEVVRAALGSIPAHDALRIRVTSTHPRSGQQFILEGWRSNFAPNMTP